MSGTNGMARTSAASDGRVSRRKVMMLGMVLGGFFSRMRRLGASEANRAPVPTASAAPPAPGPDGLAPPDAAEDCYRRGRAASVSDERLRHFREGMASARTRLARRPDDPVGLFWLAVNTGAEALERGRLQALPALPEMERLLLRCHDVAPAYEHAGAARVLGRLYHKAPPVISIGSNKKARQWLAVALAAAPDFPGNLAFSADFLSSQGEARQATELARRCLVALSGRDFGPDGVEWRAVATDVLEARR